jgi:hypothetical protein
MIIKEADDKTIAIQELQRLESIAPPYEKKQIQEELRKVRSGIQGEKESAYLLDFDFKSSKNTAIIHDLRLEIDGRVAQIDHLVIHRSMLVISLETKSFKSGFRVKPGGEFERWNDYKKTFEGMASPIAQNERHISVLKEVISKIETPRGLLFAIDPTFKNLVLVSSTARIDRPTKDFPDSAKLLKADFFASRFDELLKATPIGMCSSESLRNFCEQLVKFHKPIEFNYAAKFGLDKASVATPTAPAPTPIIPPSATPVATPQVSNPPPSGQQGSKYSCKKCNSPDLTASFGKFGYYFKCKACEGNTAIVCKCTDCGGEAKIRKAGENFFFDCNSCKSSNLFYSNK